MAESINIEYHTLVRCRELIASEISDDVKRMASVLFQHQIIFKDTLERVLELNDIKSDKARWIVSEIENTVKCYPTVYKQLLTILSESRYAELMKRLEQHLKVVN